MAFADFRRPTTSSGLADGAGVDADEGALLAIEAAPGVVVLFGGRAPRRATSRRRTTSSPLVRIGSAPKVSASWQRRLHLERIGDVLVLSLAGRRQEVAGAGWPSRTSPVVTLARRQAIGSIQTRIARSRAPPRTSAVPTPLTRGEARLHHARSGIRSTCSGFMLVAAERRDT